MGGIEDEDVAQMVFVMETRACYHLAPLSSTVAPCYELPGYHLTEAEVQPWKSAGITRHLSDWAPHRLMLSFWGPSSVNLGQQGSLKEALSLITAQSR